MTSGRTLPFRSGAANMTEVERIIRLVGGLVGTPLVYAFIARPLPGFWGLGALVPITAVAVDLIVSGIRGFCPVYRYVSLPWSRPPREEPPSGSSHRSSTTASGKHA